MNLLDAIPKFARGNRLKKIWPLFGESSDLQVEKQTEEDAGLYEANIISSEVAQGLHIPIIDLDMDAALLPSSTMGHHHLYIDKVLTFEQLIKLLEVMHEVGIVQEGVLKGAKARKYAALRLPHIHKGDEYKATYPEYKAALVKEDGTSVDSDDPFIELIKEVSEKIKLDKDGYPVVDKSDEEW